MDLKNRFLLGKEIKVHDLAKEKRANDKIVLDYPAFE